MPLKIITLSLSLVLFLFSSLVSAASSSSSVPIEAYGRLPSKSMLVISPNANRMAYRDTTSERDMLLVLDLSAGKLIAATDVTGINPNNMYFVDDDKLILVASKNARIRGFRGRHDISAAFSFDVVNNEVHQLLVAGNGIYQGQSALGNIVGISKDKKYAYMPAWRNKGSYSLFKVNLHDRRKPKLAKRGTADTISFFVGDDGQLLARERYDNRKNLHRIEAFVDDEWLEIFREEAEIRTKGFYGLSPDRQHLVMRAFNNETQRWAYYTMALKNGAISKPIFSREGHDVEYVLTDINRVVYGVKYSGFTPSYEFFDKKLNARMRGINKALPGVAVTIRDYTPDWSSIVFFVDGAQSSGDYLMYQSGVLSPLTSERPEIPAESVNQVVIDEIKARDGLTIPMLLTLPKQDLGKPLPAIMMPHGGPEAYDQIGFNWMAQYFASQGYLVIQPQFRGSKGFGNHHLQLGHGEWGRKMQDDLTDTVHELIKRGRIDANRLCIVGTSYGGYAALAGATFTPDLYQCVVSINGVSDVDRMLKQEKRDYGSDHWVVSYWQKLMNNGEVDEENLQQISPINHVKKIIAPVLLIHGEYDEVVPMKQSINMLDEMEDASKSVTFLELEKGDHYLSKQENRLKALKAIAKFVEQHI